MKLPTKFICFFIMLVMLCCMAVGCGGTDNIIGGIVYDVDGPVSKATVRLQTTELFTTTDENGRFLLDIGSYNSDNIPLTAWALGYFCGGPVSASRGDRQVVIHLEAHTTEDNVEYQWLSAFSVAGEPGNCQNCHTDSQHEDALLFPFEEWSRDAHGNSATNSRFLTMYQGVDLDGNQSPLTSHEYHPDYGTFPLPPDMSLPYYGPGFKLDFPDRTGNCATCHLPVASINDPFMTDPTQASGVELEGVNCDFCHKIWSVEVDTETLLPLPNRTGVLSYEFRRPPEEHQFFAGPYDDVAPGEDTFLELQNESLICAPCHSAIFWDTQIYNSYGEWLASPYSDPQTGQTCQDCHMPRRGAERFVREDKGGLVRRPETIFSHLMPGAADEEFLQDALSMESTAVMEGDEIKVTVTLTNDNTGHHVPTGSPLRHLLLLVTAKDDQGNVLQQSEGSTLPGWAGVGEATQGYYAGLPGKAYAKILEEAWTLIAPSASYWNPTRVVSDNRLAALASDTSIFSFTPPETGTSHIQVELFFRRAFRGLADQKGWEITDITMAQQEYQL